MAIEELAAKGPLKSEALRGLNEDGYAEYLRNDDLTVKNGLAEMPPHTGVRQIKDESHYRTGWVVSEEMSQKMLQQATAMKKLVHKSNVDYKKNLEKDVLLEQLDLTRGLMMMAYPGFHGLGAWEPIWVILENKEELDDRLDMVDDLDLAKTTLWCVNKEL